tara:strand:- start:138 stop:1019 length:882 start_codon:yes stop_codon:yes gene_type:complete
MVNTNLVSVVIPVYNSEKYVEECINSILNQTYENIEIIVVDDGSEDSSLEILENFSDKIKIFSQENQGLASSLNLGISKINGNWLKWFSPDDVMYSKTIETLVNTAKQCSEDTILYSDWNIIDDTGNTLREFHESNYNKLSPFEYAVRLLDGQQINVNTTLIPTNLLEKCTLRKLDDPVAIDYDFFLQCALLHNVKFHLIPDLLVKYRIHTDQLSHKNISKTLDYIQKIKNEIILQLDDSLQKKYLNELELYQKTKTTKRKTMELGMKLISSTPSWVSDRILTFYLNKIRQRR